MGVPIFPYESNRNRLGTQGYLRMLTSGVQMVAPRFPASGGVLSGLPVLGVGDVGARVWEYINTNTI